MTFDHPREAWYPPGLGGAGQVSNANGTPRPPLETPLDVFAVHYGGAGASWTDPGDTAAELRGVELNHARPNGKPNEYNSASDAAGETWEYAGAYRAAHSTGNNSTTWGHLTLYGLEVLTDDVAAGLIRGIRRTRAQCVAAGYLTDDHDVLPHRMLPGASTACPGPLYTTPRWWAQIVAPLTPADFDPTAEPIGDPEMLPTCYLTETKLRGTFALAAGRWVPWLFPVPAGALHFTGEHAWTREQILTDQGPAAAALWRERMTRP